MIQAAVGAPGEFSAALHRNGPLSTLSTEMHAAYSRTSWGISSQTDESIVVPVKTLDTILYEQNVEPAFSLLIVDTEGYEQRVFAGFSLAYWRPNAIIVELADMHPDLSLTRNGDRDLYRSLLAEGYVVIYKDAVNTIFIHQSLSLRARRMPWTCHPRVWCCVSPVTDCQLGADVPETTEPLWSSCWLDLRGSNLLTSPKDRVAINLAPIESCPAAKASHAYSGSEADVSRCDTYFHLRVAQGM